MSVPMVEIPRWSEIRKGDTVTVKMYGVTMMGPATVDFERGCLYVGDVEVMADRAALIKVDRNPDLDWLPMVDGVYESAESPVEQGFPPFVRFDGAWYRSGYEQTLELLKLSAPFYRLVREVAA